MTEDERLFHYNQGLKHRIRVEIEHSEIDLLAEALRMAHRMDNIFGRTAFSSNRTNSGGPEPWRLEMYPIRRKFCQTLSGRKEQAQGGKQVICMPEGWLFCQKAQQAKLTKLKKLVEPLKVTDTKTENSTVVGSRKCKKDTKK